MSAAPASTDPHHEALIIDGDPVNRQVLVHWLRKKMPDLGLRSASDGTAALEAVIAERPDLILTELVLPDVDGPELIRRIRALAAGQNAIIIAVTTQAAPGDRDRALAAGCDDYLAKPAPPVEVEELVRLWLRRGESLTDG